ncbi:MAG TPA: FecR domain-containing protein [Methyloceanibacter sp.]|nr:FecR domain-containing protein [Methyloceanibacter sp.]
MPNSSRFINKMRAHRAPAFLFGLALALALGIGFAKADKVGVAAAVNPDAFSSLSGTPNKQLNIGKSIFYNERINTTTSGLVQVLLVDGSTFTVGPNSDLVIDRFVYDPRKKTGEIVATFSKGTMRFIGGKLSKNEGGVKVNTPAGALAIRGGMVQGTVSGNKGLFSFLYGVQMSFRSNSGQTHNVYENGYTLDLRGGTPKIRPTTPDDTNFFMTALSPGGSSGTTGGNDPSGSVDPQQASNFSDSLDQIINEATATEIQDEIQRQIANLKTPKDNPSTPKDNTPKDNTTPNTPVQTAAFGYASGLYFEDDGSWHKDVGTLTNLRPTEVTLLFKDQAFNGAQFDLYADAGSWHGEGGVSITYLPVANLEVESPDDLPNSGLFLGLANHGLAPTSIAIFQDTSHFPRELVNPAAVTSGSAVLIGATGRGDFFCETCGDLTWGFWALQASYDERTVTNEHAKVPDHAVANGISETDTVDVEAIGWWIAAGAIPTVGQLPPLGFATYDGKTVGNAAIATRQGWQDYIATGDVHMRWNFEKRSGGLRISNFRDADHKLPELNAWGRMKMPGVLENPNKFAGDLYGRLGHGRRASDVSGSAVGSFVANNGNNAANAIGNWNAGNKFYKASGVFGAGQTYYNPNGVSLRR